MKPASADDKIRRYLELVRAYARTLDLSSPSFVAGFEGAIERSRAFLPELPAGGRLLDLGSGVGLPGVPLAVWRPDLQVVLCEVRKRRAAFLERIVGELGLENARVYNADVRAYRGPAVDAVTAQAVGRLSGTLDLCAHLLGPSWTLLATKTEAGAAAELAELADRAGLIERRAVPLGGGAALALVRGVSPTAATGENSPAPGRSEDSPAPSRGEDSPEAGGA